MQIAVVALTPLGGSWSPDQRIPQRAIVSTSFNVLFESLLPVIVFAWFGVARGARPLERRSRLYGAWIAMMRARRFLRTAAIYTRRGQILLLLGPLALVLFAANAIAFASVAVHALALLRPAVGDPDQLLQRRGRSVELTFGRALAATSDSGRTIPASR